MTRAQENAAQGTAASPTPTAAAANAKADFQKKFAPWKEAIKQIDLLRIEYQTADEARREQLQQELRQKFEAASKMVPGVVEAALVAYNAAPAADEELQQFLMAVVNQKVATDRHEEALPIIETLSAGGVTHPALSLWGVVAAFAVADYEAAVAHLERAQESGILAEPPRTNNHHEKGVW
jgi:hypothetical protein